MIIVLKKVSRLFERREKRRLMGIFFLILLGSLAEAIGVALIPIFIAILNSPTRVVAVLEARGWDGPIAGMQHQNLVLLASVALALFFLAKNVFLVTLVYVQARFIAGQQTKLSLRLLSAYLFKPYTFHLSRNTAELLRNLSTEVVQVFHGVIMPSFGLMSEILVVCLIGALLIAVEPLSSLLAVIAVGSVSVGYYLLSRRGLGKLGEVHQRHAGEMMKWVNQSLGGVKEIKILGRETFFIESYRRSIGPYVRALRLLNTLNQVPRYLMETVAIAGMVLVIILMIRAGREIGAVLPSLALFAVAAVRMIPSFSRIVTHANSVRYYGPAVEAVHADLLDVARSDDSVPIAADRSKSGDPEPALRFESSIELQQVTFRYPGSSELGVTDVSLSIPKGASVALAGPSGAGKTTLVDIVLGLLTPSEGRVLVDGRDIRGMLTSWQKMVGYVPQSIYLSDDSIRRNVAFGVMDEQINEQAVMRALESAQLADFVRGLPAGLDTFVGERGVRLSGGQRQRLGIARALYHRPEVLVLDEATAALDHRTEREITDVIASLHGEQTILAIAHRMSTIRHFDEIFLIVDGRVLASGGYGELLAECSDFRMLVG